MYNHTVLLCYNYTMTGLILIIYPGLCFVFGGPFTFSNEEDIFTLTVFPMAKWGGLFRTSLPLSEDFVELLHPQKLIAGTPKMMVLKMSLLSFRDDFSGSNVRLRRFVLQDHEKTTFCFLGQNWLQWNLPLQTSSILKNRQHPKPKKNTELVSCTKTQRQEKPFRFSSNSLDGRTFRIVMATRLPATRLATSTRHHGDVLVLPAKQTWNPKNWLFLLEIKVFPLSLGSSG